MRSHFACLGFACLLWLSLTPALAISQEAELIRDLRAKAVEAQFHNNYDTAIENYQRAADIASRTYGANSAFLSEIYYDMGTLALTNSQFKNAEEWLNMTVKLNPNSSSGRLKLAELQMVKGRPEEAVKLASMVVSKHRDDVVAHQELARALDRSDDVLKAYREFSAAEALIRIEQARYEGKAPPARVNLSPALRSAAPASAPASSADPKAKKVDDKKAAELAKKAAVENQKKAEAARKAADAEAKKAKAEMAKFEAAERAAAKKAADAAKKAEAAKAAKAKKKAAPAPKVQSDGGMVATEAKPLTGLPAKLKSTAVLLTPVSKKRNVSAESSSTEIVPAKPVLKKIEPKIDPESEPEDDVIPPKPVKKAAPKPVEMVAPVIKPVKAPRRGGLVPPPPPVIPSMPMMIAPPPAVMAPPPKPKAAAPKKEAPKAEAPKEDKPAASTAAEDDDFLLDWGGASNKHKKKEK